MKSFSGTLGLNTGGVGSVTVTGTGSQWIFNNVSNDFQIGQATNSGSGSLSVLNGGVVNATSLVAYNSATLLVDGAGSKLDLTANFGVIGPLTLGQTGTNNTLTVSNGAALVTGSAIFATQAGSAVTIMISGSGTLWTDAAGTSGTPIIQVGGGGAGVAGLTVSSQAVVSGSGDIEVDSSGTATLTISGSAFVKTGTSSALRIGKNTAGIAGHEYRGHVDGQ